VSGEARRAASDRESPPGRRQLNDERRGTRDGDGGVSGEALRENRAPFGICRAWPLVVLAVVSVAHGFAPAARAQNVADAYINPRGNVVVVAKDGRPTTVTSMGGCERIVVAKDRRTVAWSRSTRKGSAVFVYREGAVRKIEGNPFVRDYWFVDGGRKIAVASGGLYFAGWESLYDVATLKLIDEFNQNTTPMESRPWWSTSSEVYSGD
jgi:hypothetical protein